MGAWRSDRIAPPRSYSEQAGVAVTDGILGAGIAAFILWTGAQTRAARASAGAAGAAGAPGTTCGCLIPAGWSPPTITGGCLTCSGCLLPLTVTPTDGGGSAAGVAPLGLSG